MEADYSCQSREHAIASARKIWNEFQNSPFLLAWLDLVGNRKSDLKEELDYFQLVKQKYGLGDIRYYQLTEKITNMIKATELIFSCPCCHGVCIHSRIVRESGDSPWEHTSICKTCEGKGVLDF